VDRYYIADNAELGEIKWLRSIERPVFDSTRRPAAAGVFRVRNTATGKSLVGSSANLPGTLNRTASSWSTVHTEQGTSGGLERSWPGCVRVRSAGPVEPSDKPDSNATEDLRVLKELWLEKLMASGELLYREAGRAPNNSIRSVRGS